MLPIHPSIALGIHVNQQLDMVDQADCSSQLENVHNEKPEASLVTTWEAAVTVVQPTPPQHVLQGRDPLNFQLLYPYSYSWYGNASSSQPIKKLSLLPIFLFISRAALLMLH